MAPATLTINSRNYGSWSLRGWLLCRMAGLDFVEEVLPAGDPATRAELLLLSPSFLVPRLEHAGVTVWDALAIAEYLQERFPHAGLLPDEPVARAHCRSISCEVHGGFVNLRSALPMNMTARHPGFPVFSGREGRHRPDHRDLARLPRQVGRPVPVRPPPDDGGRDVRADLLAVRHLRHRRRRHVCRLPRRRARAAGRRRVGGAGRGSSPRSWWSSKPSSDPRPASGWPVVTVRPRHRAPVRRECEPSSLGESAGRGQAWGDICGRAAGRRSRPRRCSDRSSWSASRRSWPWVALARDRGPAAVAQSCPTVLRVVTAASFAPVVTGVAPALARGAGLRAAGRRRRRRADRGGAASPSRPRTCGSRTTPAGRAIPDRPGSPRRPPPVRGRCSPRAPSTS